jgi:hypothetical protein
MQDLWTFGPIAPEGSERTDVDGFALLDVDGEEVGRVVEASYEPESSCLVVETGVWLVGRRVLIPAGFVSGMDPDDEVVNTRLTKEQIKNSPGVDPDMGDMTSQQGRDEVADYFDNLR